MIRPISTYCRPRCVKETSSNNIEDVISSARHIPISFSDAQLTALRQSTFNIINMKN